MTVDQVMATLYALSMAGWGDKEVHMWPADIPNQQLVDNVEFDDLSDAVVLY